MLYYDMAACAALSQTLEGATVSIRVAAIQLEAQVGDRAANLQACSDLVDEAAAGGAEWVVLPEFFDSGVGNLPQLRDEAAPPDGPPVQLLRKQAAAHGIYIGGSTLMRDSDGHVRNAFILVGPDGRVRGRHDKDLPTMWESALYTPGSDPGIIQSDGLAVGAALCWELIRTQTVERLAGVVDLVLSGSAWWSVPAWRPRTLSSWLQHRNECRALTAPSTLARHVGVPVVHAAHSGALECPFVPELGHYRGFFCGGASISDARGHVVASRSRSEGPGVAFGNVATTRIVSTPPPARFWLQRRGVLETVAWTVQNNLGRRRYRSAAAERHA